MLGLPSRPASAPEVSDQLEDQDIRSPDKKKAAEEVLGRHKERLDFLIDEKERRINSLKRDSVNLDAPDKQRKAREELKLTIDELDRTQKNIEAGKKAIVDIQDEARRANVPPGWVKAGG